MAVWTDVNAFRAGVKAGTARADSAGVSTGEAAWTVEGASAADGRSESFETAQQPPVSGAQQQAPAMAVGAQGAGAQTAEGVSTDARSRAAMRRFTIIILLE